MSQRLMMPRLDTARSRKQHTASFITTVSAPDNHHDNKKLVLHTLSYFSVRLLMIQLEVQSSEASTIHLPRGKTLSSHVDYCSVTNEDVQTEGTKKKKTLSPAFPTADW